MRRGFLVISGCPRSGTSVNMDIQRAVHGEEVILGSKFPQENRQKMRLQMTDRQDGEPDHLWQVRRYLTDKQVQAEDAKMPVNERQFRDMNPEGFWEMNFTVTGISPYMVRRGASALFSPHLQGLLDEVENGAFRIVKVVSQGLMPSNPRYIGKIIYTIRHPRAVAKSQERLVRGFNYRDENGDLHNAFEDMVIHTPEMFIHVTTMAASFLLSYLTIPIRFYHFEDLVAKPCEVIDDMGEFVGVGDYTKAYDIVQPRLNRSKHEDVESPLWDDAEFVYARFCEAADVINEYKGDNANAVRKRRKMAESALKSILEYMADPKRQSNREKRSWLCYRAKHQVTEAMCRECVKGGEVARNFKTHSETTESHFGVTKHWSEEPCLFECGMDLDRNPDDYLTIEESIRNNSWHDVPVTTQREDVVSA